MIRTKRFLGGNKKHLKSLMHTRVELIRYYTNLSFCILLKLKKSKFLKILKECEIIAQLAIRINRNFDHKCFNLLHFSVCLPTHLVPTIHISSKLS